MGIGNFISDVLKKKDAEKKEGEEIKQAVGQQTLPENSPEPEVVEEPVDENLRDEVAEIQEKVDNLDKELEDEKPPEPEPLPEEKPVVAEASSDKQELASLKKKRDELNKFIKTNPPKAEPKGEELKKLEKKILEEVAKKGSAVDVSKFASKKELIEAEKRLIESFKVAQVKSAAEIDTSVFVRKSELAPIKKSISNIMKLLTSVMKAPSISKDELDSKFKYLKSEMMNELREFAKGMAELDARMKNVEGQATSGGFEEVKQDFESLSQELERKIAEIRSKQPEDISKLQSEIEELRDALSKAADVSSVSEEIERLKKEVETRKGLTFNDIETIKSQIAPQGSSELKEDFEALKKGVEDEMQHILAIVGKFREVFDDYATKEDISKVQMGDPQAYEQIAEMRRNIASIEGAMKRWEPYFSGISQRLEALEARFQRPSRTVIE